MENRTHTQLTHFNLTYRHVFNDENKNKTTINMVKRISPIQRKEPFAETKKSLRNSILWAKEDLAKANEKIKKLEAENSRIQELEAQIEAKKLRIQELEAEIERLNAKLNEKQNTPN